MQLKRETKTVTTDTLTLALDVQEATALRRFLAYAKLSDHHEQNFTVRSIVKAIHNELVNEV